MNTLLLTILISLLMLIIFQDFKHRAISWFLIPLLFVGFVFYALLSIDLEELLINFGVNFYIVFTSLIGATLIISVKNKKLTNIVNTYLGLGDILFFLVLAIVFSPINFILFYIGSIFSAGLVFGGIALIRKKEDVSTPLAGVMSLLLVIVMLTFQAIPNLHLSQDFLFLF